MADIVLEELKDIASRNQILLEGVKNGLNKKFRYELVKLQKSIDAAIRGAPDIQGSKARRNALVKKVNDIQAAIYADYLDALNLDMEELGLDQAVIEAQSYGAVTTGYKPVVPTAQQVITAYSVNYLQVENYAGDKLFAKFLSDTSKKEIKRVNAAVIDGFATGLTNEQIARTIKGTKKQNYTDGILKKVDNSFKSMIKTAVQHVAVQGQMETMKRNGDFIKGYKISVTFDSRTTTLCRDIGQKNITYEVGKGPVPPLHWGCRDVVVPVIDSKFDYLKEGATKASKGSSGGAQIDARAGSYDWILTQSVDFQNASMGKTRAKLLRDGGITPTEYARLSSNNFNVPLTIKQMREKAPLVFENAGL